MTFIEVWNRDAMLYGVKMMRISSCPASSLSDLSG